MEQEKQQDQMFEKKLGHLMGDDSVDLPFRGRLRRWFKNPSEAQRVGKRAFLKELFSLALRTVSPFAALHKSVLMGTFGLSQVSAASEAINNVSNWNSGNTIYLKTRSSLTDETAQTMPEVEWEMKSSILDYNLEAISRRSVEFVNSKSQKHSSIIGVIASSAVLTALNPAFLALGIPAYLIGQYLSEKRGEVEKNVFPHERKVLNDTYKKNIGTSSNVEQHFIQNDRKKQGEELLRANEDLKEVSEYRQNRQKPFIWQSILATTALTGIALAASWTAPITTLIGVYAATNAFLGSLQSWSMARHTQKEVLRNMRRSYTAIKHQEEFNLKTGNQKLPENINAFEIDCPQFSWRKTKEGEMGKREEQPVLDFSQKFYFAPGINVLGGISGAGKSTLYKLLRHFDDLNRGSISVGTMKDGHFIGKKLTDLSIDDACSTTAFSFSELRFEGDITAIELIKKANPKIGKRFLEKIGSSEWFDIPLWMDKHHMKPRRIRDMSKGQKDRVSTICALVSTKKILVLDEPTSKIDKENIKRVLSVINQLGKRKTIIYTTHNPVELLHLDVSNIVYLDQQKDAEGNALPTDVKVYERPSNEEIRKYVNDGSLHDPKTKEEQMVEEEKKDKKNESMAKEFDEELQKTEEGPEPQEEPHVNFAMRDLLRSGSAAHVMRLHAIAKNGALSRPKTLVQKILDLSARKAIERKVDPKKHKRLFRHLHDPNR